MATTRSLRVCLARSRDCFLFPAFRLTPKGFEVSGIMHPWVGFRDFWQGFRPRKNAHKALRAVSTPTISPPTGSAPAHMLK